MMFSRNPPNDLTNKYYECFWLIPVEKFVYAWALFEMLWYGLALFVLTLILGMDPIILLFVPFIVSAVLMFVGNWKKMWWLFVPELAVWATLFFVFLTAFCICVVRLIESLVLNYGSEYVWKYLLRGLFRFLATLYFASIGGVIYRGFQYICKADEQNKKSDKEAQIVLLK
ncbi:hypothetical protein M3Y97_01039000 [Aphelenchoides bicaudatus]|nr:hypothetical protein M3Y97_01039000 [Aphelenchoides bicaudatus]